MKVLLLSLALCISSFAAIASDNNSVQKNAGDTGAGTITQAITVGSGSNRVLWVYGSTCQGSITGATYNGVSMTAVQSSSSGCAQTLFFLAAPASGTFNIVLSSGSTYINLYLAAASYSGVSQTAPTGAAIAFNSGTVSGGTFMNTTVTNPNNGWVFLGGNDSSNGGTIIASNVTILQQTNGYCGADTNGSVITGSYTVGIREASSATMQAVVAAFGPPTAAAFAANQSVIAVQ